VRSSLQGKGENVKVINREESSGWKTSPRPRIPQTAGPSYGLRAKAGAIPNGANRMISFGKGQLIRGERTEKARESANTLFSTWKLPSQKDHRAWLLLRKSQAKVPRLGDRVRKNAKQV